MSFQSTRREILAAVGTLGAGGCLSTGGDTLPSSPTRSTGTSTPTRTGSEPTNPETATEEQGAQHRVHVVNHAVKDVDFERVEDLQFSVRVTDPEITEGSTATVVLERENTGNDEIEVGVNPDYPYPEYSSNVGESLGIVLVSPKTHDLQTSEPGCWGLETLPVIFPGDTMILDPGESVAEEYEVWTEPTEQRRCLQPGTYSFEQRLVAWTLRIAEA